MDRCEIVEVRTLEDAEGYVCCQGAVARCGDCGAAVCGSHAEHCELCGETFCPSCVSFHRSEHAKPTSSEIPMPQKRRRA